ncbi:PREDICTED: miraculin-like [Ipomoea nil]|uniref:miraculin-like n=1 Tax=Ipomoea nil TaxID=35883 RepID=UPI0009016E17|nr:PREDICTED: miraculin-like [Ipomoea nil]
MKFSHFLILSLLSLLSFAFTALSNPHPFSDGGTPSLVLDADGGRLQAGVNYLVLPVIPGRGGGLSPANINEKSSCPRDIIQEASEIQTGFPVSFSPVDTATGSVPLSTDINVKFFTPTVCSNETVWRVGKYDEVLKRYFIVTGGVEGNPGPETIANWFKIEKLESDYKIVFCPSVCSICQVVCDDVGIYVGTGGTKFLALSDSPLVVKFKRAFPFTAPPVSHGPPQPVPFSYAPPPPPVPFLHEPPPPPVPFPHAPPPPVPEPHGPPPPVPEPHRSPPPVPVPHGPPPPVPEPHRPPPPPVPVPAGPPPPDTSLAVATLQSPPYARPFVIFVSVLLFLGLS